MYRLRTLSGICYCYTSLVDACTCLAGTCLHISTAPAVAPAIIERNALGYKLLVLDTPCNMSRIPSSSSLSSPPLLILQATAVPRNTKKELGGRGVDVRVVVACVAQSDIEYWSSCDVGFSVLVDMRGGAFRANSSGRRLLIEVPVRIQYLIVPFAFHHGDIGQGAGG